MKKILICFLSLLLVMLTGCNKGENFIVYTNNELISGESIINDVNSKVWSFQLPVITNKKIDSIKNVHIDGSNVEELDVNIYGEFDKQWSHDEFKVLDTTLSINLKDNRSNVQIEEVIIEVEVEGVIHSLRIPFNIDILYDFELGVCSSYFFLLEWHDTGPSEQYPIVEITSRPNINGTLSSISTGNNELINEVKVGISNNTNYNDRPKDNLVTFNDIQNLNVLFNSSNNMKLELVFEFENSHNAIRVFPIILDINVNGTNHKILYSNFNMQYETKNEIIKFLGNNKMELTIYD